MKILFHSYAFAPSVGGIESVSDILARQWAGLGHEIILVTLTEGEAQTDYPFKLIRCPSIAESIDLIRWCDIVFQNNLSAQLLWPALFLRKPVLVTTQTWVRRTDGTISWRDFLKRQLLRFPLRVSISESIANDIPSPSIILGNPYREDVFKVIDGVPRERDLLFVGRLVSDKGLDILLHALAELGEVGMVPRLSVVGDGPERTALENLCKTLSLSNQVEFLGVKKGSELAKIMNAHRILVIPSLWAEPFGIVALEGIACGCIAVGSEEGGLKDAIGPCGLVFPNGDSHALAGCLREAITNPRVAASVAANMESHLAKFKGEALAHRYLDLFEKLLN